MSFIFIKPKQYCYVRFLLLTTLFFSSNAFAQNSTLTGKVIDVKTKSPLAGATVHIKGSTHEVVTNDKGEFTFITAQHFPLTYAVSFVGYQTNETTQIEQGYFTIALIQSAHQLKDFVFVGYGTQSRKNLASAVTSVNVSQIEDIPATSVEDNTDK